jgi:hypothetical protein
MKNNLFEKLGFWLIWLLIMFSIAYSIEPPSSEPMVMVESDSARTVINLAYKLKKDTMKVAMLEVRKTNKACTVCHQGMKNEK